MQVVLVQVEAGRIQVLGQDLWSRGLGDDGQASLGGPSEEDLSDRLVVLGGNLLDDGVLQQRGGALGSRHIQLHEAGGAEGGVGCDGDALSLSQVDEVGLLEVRVVLDLERSRADLGILQSVIHGLRLVVGDADAARQLLLDQLLHGSPGLLEGGLAPPDLLLAVVEPSGRVADAGVDVLERSREVDEEEVKVVDLPVGELLAGDGLHLVLVVEGLPQLGDDEELLTLHEAVLDGAGNALTGLLFVAIICVSGRGDVSADVAPNELGISRPTFKERKRGRELFISLSFFLLKNTMVQTHHMRHQTDGSRP